MSTITSQRMLRLRIVTMFMTYIPSSSTVVAFLVATTMRLCDRMLQQQQQQQQQRLRAMKLEKRKPLQNGSVRTRTCFRTIQEPQQYFLPSLPSS